MSNLHLFPEFTDGGSYHYSSENLDRLIENLKNFIKVISEDTSLALPLIIALDGSAAVGKTQIVRLLEEKLNYQQMSKGLLARVFTWVYSNFEWKEDFDEKEIKEIEEFTKVCQELQITLKLVRGKNLIELSSDRFDEPVCLDPNGFEITDGLRSDQVNQKVSKISGLPSIVQLIHTRAREIAKQLAEKHQPLVTDGRDNAKTFLNFTLPVAKAYLYAQDEAIRFRAKERLRKQWNNDHPGIPIDPEELEKAGQKAIDRTREDIEKSDGRLVSLEEAYQLLEEGKYNAVIDTTEMAIEETFFHVLITQWKVLEMWLRDASNQEKAAVN